MLPITKSFLTSGIQPATAQQKSAVMDDLRGIALLMANREVAAENGTPIPPGPAKLFNAGHAEATRAKSQAATPTASFTMPTAAAIAAEMVKLRAVRRQLKLPPDDN